MKAGEEYRRAKFEFYIWQTANGTNFHCQLYALIAKSDLNNKERLRKGFPCEVLVFEEWQSNSSPDEYVEGCRA